MQGSWAVKPGTDPAPYMKSPPPMAEWSWLRLGLTAAATFALIALYAWRVRRLLFGPTDAYARD